MNIRLHLLSTVAPIAIGGGPWTFITAIVRYFFLICLLLPCIAMAGSTPDDFYFFSREDMATMKRSAATEWGRQIVGTLQNKVKDRKRHPLHVPETEGGYVHNYFCLLHNVRFTFEWDSPHAHFCPVCNKRWEGNAKFDAAWIATVHDRNLDYLTANMYLLLVTDSTVYADNIKTMLLDYARWYPKYVEHNRDRVVADKYSGRLYSQSLDEAVWAIMGARVYHAVKSFMTADERRTVEQNYLRPCASMLMRKQNKGNWQAWHNGAIAALGVALQNDSIVTVAINDPSYGYRAVMAENVYGDGWWTEGSATYHFYPLRGILLTAEAVRCRNIDLYTPQLINMFLSPVRMMYADLTFPSLNDGAYAISLTEHTALYEIMAGRTGDRNIKDLLNLIYTKKRRTAPEALLNGIDLKGENPAVDLASTYFQDLGVAVLRSGGRTAILKYGPDGGIHGHPDKLTICIHDGDRELFPDLGATAYSLAVCRDWYQTTIAHNTITVDQHNQQKTTGTLLNFKAAKDGGEVEAKAAGAYPGVEMRRRLKLKKEKLEDQMIISADTAHIFDYALMSAVQLILPEAKDTALVAYPRIEAMRYTRNRKSCEFKCEDFTLNIKVVSESSAEFYTGQAPGTPPKGGQKELNKIYPLLVRSKGKRMEIISTWTFKSTPKP